MSLFIEEDSTTVINEFKARLSSDTKILLVLAAARLLLHFITNALGGYGYFRDELYYLACTEHPDLGYVDHPPLSIYVLSVSRFLFGDSLFALRLVPALAGAVVVFLTGLMTRELGGGRTAQVLAATASLLSPILLGMGSIYSMNSLDILLWTLAYYTLIRLVKTDDKRMWLLLGGILGAGLLNKTSALWLGAGIVGGVVLTQHRRWLRTPWPWVAGLIALGLFVPYIVWNTLHGFPHLEFVRNATAGKYSSLTAWTFITGQLLIHNPVTIPLWLSGLIFLLFVSREKQHRLLGVCFAVVFMILALNGRTKAEYLAAAFGILFSAGGVMIERWGVAGVRRRLVTAYLVLMCVSGLLLVPVVLPILPVETYIRYADALGIAPSTSENNELGRLPQFYADMFGWEGKARAIATVFHSMAPEDQAKCGIYAGNYGRCGAIDFFGRPLGLPRSVGGHNSYWLWGPRDVSGELIIALGGREEDYRQVFGSVEVAGTVQNDYCMPYENNLNIYICRNISVPLADMWGKVKNFH